MPRKRNQQAPPVIAQLISSTAISYELQVFSHNGFLVQLRTRGVGPPQPVFRWKSDPEPYKVEYAAYEKYFFPVLNEKALARRGLKLAEVEAWLEMPGNDGFTHPECVPLCLRWGQNAEGIYAVEYTIPAGNADQQVGFIPYSCSKTGLTYYCLCYDDSFHHTRQEKELRVKGILLEHTEQIGSEGNWRGWYSTDLAALQNALAMHRLSPVLVQYIAEYYVSLHESELGVSVWNECYYLRSEADARYDEFPANPAYDAFQTNEYPRLIRASGQTVRGRHVDGGMGGEKVLFKHHLRQARRGKAPAP